MTIVLTQPRLLTVAEYWAVAEVRHQLKPQLPTGYEILLDIDVDLGLVPPDQPGFCRRPDLIVVRREARQRQRRGGGVIRASDVVVIMEVVSPGSRRTDHVAKRSEYADAGIVHYWIIDLTDPISMLACHLAGEFGYVDSRTATGTIRTTEPFRAEIDLTALL